MQNRAVDQSLALTDEGSMSITRQAGHPFHANPATDYAASRPPISDEAGHF